MLLYKIGQTFEKGTATVVSFSLSGSTQSVWLAEQADKDTLYSCTFGDRIFYKEVDKHIILAEMKWIDKMVEHLTRKDTPLNDSFKINRHQIDCQSGTSDFVDVVIDNSHHFSFDFWIKELYLDSECGYLEHIIQAFKNIYGTIKVVDD